jgi:uncharacterized protein (TIRG00374 family)
MPADGNLAEAERPNGHYSRHGQMSREGVPAPAPDRRFGARRILLLLFGLFLVAALIVVSRPAEIWETIQEASLSSVLLALALNVPVVLLRLVRAAIVLRRVGYTVPLRMLLAVQLMGQMVSSMTPASSGDYIRAYVWRTTAGVPLRTGAAVVMFERVFSFVLMVGLALALVLFLPLGAAGWMAIVAAVVVITMAPSVLERISPEVERWVLLRATSVRFLSRYTDGVLGMAEYLRQLFGSTPLLIIASLITIAIYALNGLQVWLLIGGLGAGVSLPQAVAAYTTSQAGGTLSTLPFGIGSMDALMVTVLAAYGLAIATSTTVAVLLRATATLPQGVAGLIAYFALQILARRVAR